MGEDQFNPDTTPTLGPEDPESGGSVPSDNASGESGSKKQLGPYEIIEEIGRGGMGVVYKAFHPQLKRTVALKVLIAGEDASEEAIARFHREAEAVAKLGHHPNIVPVYDIGQEGRNHYFAMHFVDGKPLDKMIDEGEISPKQAAVITKKLAEALHHAHQHGILHRDIKPANVLMSSEIPNPKSQIPTKSQIPNLNDTGSGRSGRAGGASGESGSEPMLTDFGLAKDVESESKMTRSGMTLGTPQYMPPEQADGRLRDIDERSDVYSLGATLYEMLTDEPPFSGETVINVIQKVLIDDPVSLRKKNPLVDKDLETICLKCLEKERERRYSNTASLARDLENYISGDPIAARPPSLRYRVRKKARRHRAALITAVVALLLLMGGGITAAIVVFGKEREKRKETARADAESAAKTGEQRLREKNQKVAKVMMDATVRLREIHGKLKASWYDDGRSAEEKKAFFRSHEKELDAFFSPLLPDGSPFPSSSAEQSAALALKGWFTRLGGDKEESLALFARSRETDPNVGWGYLFEAMAHLVDYISEIRLPPSIIGPASITFEEMPEETASMGALREIFEGLASKMQGAKVWGGERSEDFSWALEKATAIAGRDASAGEAAVSSLLRLTELHWIEEDLLFVHARLLYLSLDFEKGVKEVLKFIECCPDSAKAFNHFGFLKYGLACERIVAGKDPRELLGEAINGFTEALRRCPEYTDALVGLGIAAVTLGEVEASRGLDPRDSYRRAIRECDKALGLVSSNPAAYNSRGNAYLQLGKAEAARGLDPRESYQRAIENYGEGLRRNPGAASVQVNRGNAYTFLGDAESARGLNPLKSYHQAVTEFNEALHKKPGDLLALNNRGLAYAKIGEAEEERGLDPRASCKKAIQDCTEVLHKNPGFPTAYNTRGMATLCLARAEAARGLAPGASFRKAIKDFDEALQRKPDYAVAFNNRGNAYRGIGLAEAGKGRDPREFLTKAIKDYGEGLHWKPDYAEAMVNRGGAYFNLGEAEAARGKDPRDSYRKAIQNCDEALRRKPDCAVGYVNRGCARFGLAQAEAARGRDPSAFYERAIADYSKALQRKRDCAQAYYNRGNARVGLARATKDKGLDARENFRRAIQDFGEALRWKPGYPEVYVNRGNAFLNLGLGEEAKGLDPRDSYEKAIEDSGKALGWNPGLLEAYFNRGNARMLLGIAMAHRDQDPCEYYRNAVSDFGEVLQRDPDYPLANFKCASTYRRLGIWEAAKGLDPRDTYRKAIFEFDKALLLNPDYVLAYNGRGNTRMMLGDAEGARGLDPRETYRKGLSDCDEMLRLNPRLWQGFGIQGMLLERLCDFQGAVKAYEKAQELITTDNPSLTRGLKRVRILANLPPWRRDLVLAGRLRNWGDLSGAGSLYEKSLPHAETASAGDENLRAALKLLYFDLARICSVATTGKKTHLAEAGPLSPERIAELQAKAVGNLRKAFERGWTDMDRIRKDPELAPLRELPAFKALLREWEKRLQEGK
ncbi:MAG: protein kinase domain-containing protein [Planctomycetota bacterium]|jgi:serine/threonine-protein kinase